MIGNALRLNLDFDMIFTIGYCFWQQLTCLDLPSFILILLIRWLCLICILGITVDSAARGKMGDGTGFGKSHAGSCRAGNVAQRRQDFQNLKRVTGSRMCCNPENLATSSAEAANMWTLRVWQGYWFKSEVGINSVISGMRFFAGPEYKRPVTQL